MGDNLIGAVHLGYIFVLTARRLIKDYKMWSLCNKLEYRWTLFIFEEVWHEQ